MVDELFRLSALCSPTHHLPTIDLGQPRKASSFQIDTFDI